MIYLLNGRYTYIFCTMRRIFFSSLQLTNEPYHALNWDAKIHYDRYAHLNSVIWSFCLEISLFLILFIRKPYFTSIISLFLSLSRTFFASLCMWVWAELWLQSQYEYIVNFILDTILNGNFCKSNNWHMENDNFVESSIFRVILKFE